MKNALATWKICWQKISRWKHPNQKRRKKGGKSHKKACKTLRKGRTYM